MTTQPTFTPQNLGTNWYGNVWLALATLAYTDDATGEISGVARDLAKRIDNMQMMPGPLPGAAIVPGVWNLDWGPVYTTGVDFNANMMYAVSYRDADGPLFAAIVIRGTDTSESYSAGGLLLQLVQDLDVHHMVMWTDAGKQNPPLVKAAAGLVAAIAHGSADGLNDLLSMTSALNNPLPNMPSGAVGIADYAGALAAGFPSLPVIVTGHSLGGCQATVMAMYLSRILGSQIVPHPFAPPTAGNAAWNALYQQTFPNGQVWWNTADVVPNAFENTATATPTTASLANILNMWGPVYGGSLPLTADLAEIVGYYQNVTNGAYQSLANSLPAANVQRLLGSYMTPYSPDKSCPDNLITQLMLQHFPPMYSYLMQQQLSLAAFPTPSVTTPPQPTCTVPSAASS